MEDKDDSIKPTEIDVRVRESERIEPEEDFIEIGQWYWVKDDKTCHCTRGMNCSCEREEHEWLGCVVHVGTNYAELHSPHVYPQSYETLRIHFNEFHLRCRLEPNSKEIIEERINLHRRQAKQLMLEVKETTARLGVTPRVGIESGAAETTSALMTMHDAPDVEEYEAALIKAKEKELPDLFKEIEEENGEMARWMSAEILPMKARLEGMKEIIDKVDDRIFNVTLYAGLTEKATQVRDGEPAPMGEKLRVMQARLYMDEECLANYKTGGMNYRHIKEFDAWLGETENLERVLPFPRCIVAFRVRREGKTRGMDRNPFVWIAEFEANIKTYLYIRNGGQLFRLDTSLEFDEKIFPDITEFEPKQLRAKMFAGSIDRFITEDDYQVRKAEYEEKKRKHEEWAAANPKKHWMKNPYSRDYWSPGEYQPFDPSSVYYDDMNKKLQAEIKKYNRIALILQGLFDRSPILHPHPPVQLWTPEGFQTAVELVYDADRVLSDGDKPDFEAYRKKCNKSLKDGAVVVGQQEAWEIREAEKECERRDNDYRWNKSDHRPERWKPEGNPGPGWLAHVHKYMKKAKKCTFAWLRERLKDGYSKKGYHSAGDPIRTTATFPESVLFCVDGYKPGDYKVFFQDRRTRAEYLKWAPMLLAAEEYHAGKLKATAPLASLRETHLDTNSFEMQLKENRVIEAAMKLLGWEGKESRKILRGIILNWRHDATYWLKTSYYEYIHAPALSNDEPAIEALALQARETYPDRT